MGRTVLLLNTARNIEHPTVIPWDVSFAPNFGDFSRQWYQCILTTAPKLAKIHHIAYLAQNTDASL